MKQRHIDCRDSNCEICFEDHIALERELKRLTGCKSEDHLGKFHLWLSKRGIPPETEYGWGTEAYFDDDNISAYVKDFVEGEA